MKKLRLFILSLFLTINVQAAEVNKNKEIHIHKVWVGNSKAHFPKKEILKIDPWINADMGKCTESSKRESYGKAQIRYNYTFSCKKKRTRKIYYKDGTIVLEKRLVKL